MGDRQASPGWIGAALSGFALIAVAAMLVVVFGFLDATHYTSIQNLFTPDPPAAAGILGVVGGAEGVTLSIVILVVVFGIQMTSSRYSPRIIGLFTTNPLNAIVLGFSLASILYTFLVRGEVKTNYVPDWSVGAAVACARRLSSTASGATRAATWPVRLPARAWSSAATTCSHR